MHKRKLGSSGTQDIAGFPYNSSMSGVQANEETSPQCHAPSKTAREVFVHTFSACIDTFISKRYLNISLGFDKPCLRL